MKHALRIEGIVKSKFQINIEEKLPYTISKMVKFPQINIFNKLYMLYA